MPVRTHPELCLGQSPPTGHEADREAAIAVISCCVTNCKTSCCRQQRWLLVIPRVGIGQLCSSLLASFLGQVVHDDLAGTLGSRYGVLVLHASPPLSQRGGLLCCMAGSGLGRGWDGTGGSCGASGALSWHSHDSLRGEAEGSRPHPLVGRAHCKGLAGLRRVGHR